MPTKTMILGVVLIALGVIVTFASDSGSATSMIPAFVGVIFLVIGAVAAAREDLRKHLMHAAAGVALIAILGSVGSLISRFSEASNWAIFSQIATVVLCAGFIQQAVASFKAARLARESGGTSDIATT